MSSNEKLLKDLLTAHGLKRTPIRIEILQIFLDCDYALSAKDLIQRLTTDHDRVTVYRALASFEKNGILHRASEDHSGIKYAICNNHCPSEAHADMHAHFVCENCQQTYCLDQVTIPNVKVNEGFSVDKVAFTMSGTCKFCTA
ncbi:MAG: transcriptional repressor [Cyclobacteriaceae bacterium]